MTAGRFSGAQLERCRLCPVCNPAGLLQPARRPEPAAERTSTKSGVWKHGSTADKHQCHVCLYRKSAQSGEGAGAERRAWDPLQSGLPRGGNQVKGSGGVLVGVGPLWGRVAWGLTGPFLNLPTKNAE